MPLSNENVGIWFLPDNKNPINGTLKKSEEGEYYLILFNSFDGILDNNLPDYPVVQGVLSSGEEISLFDVLVIRTKFSLPGFPILECRVSYIYVGALYNSMKEIKISKAKISYKYLNYWINEKSITTIWIKETNEIITNYEMPKLKTFEFDNMNLKFNFKVKTTGDFYSNYELKQTGFIEFDFKEAAKVDDLLEEMNSFSDFLTLCYGELALKEQVLFYDSNSDEIEFIYDVTQAVKIKELSEKDMFIKFSFIAEDFQNCYMNWKQKRELLRPTISYFVEAHERVFHIPMSFLKIVQALEAFSRRNRCNESMSKEKFGELQERLTSCLAAEDDKQLVLGMLSNEPRLRKRLNDLFSEVNNIFNIPSKKRKSIINKIVNTRNYFTHFDNSLENKKMEPEEIIYISKYMKLVLRVILLKELDVSEELIEIRIKESKEFNDCKNNLELC
ncbi:HEPN domain-containing protein [Listeria grayi]|nr:HEPN domain-containing protein [Listeria grayi]